MEGTISEKLAAYRKQAQQDSEEIFVARDICECIDCACIWLGCCCNTDTDYADKLHPDTPGCCYWPVTIRDCIYGCFCRG